MSMRMAALSAAMCLLSGCASVSMESKDISEAAKKFDKPSPSNAGIYIFRTGGPGAALKKDIWIDGKCVGESAPDVFFYQQVQGDTEHTVSTESEFSPNDLIVKTSAGSNYFIRQYIRIGVFVGGANLELVPEEEGRKEVSLLQLAKSGNCSKPR